MGSDLFRMAIQKSHGESPGPTGQVGLPGQERATTGQGTEALAGGRGSI